MIPSRTLESVAEAGPLLADHGVSRAVLVVDTELEHSATADALRLPLARSGVSVQVHPVSGPGTLAGALELGRRLEDADAVIALGGGSVMDRAKAAVIAGSLQEAATSAEPGHRPGALVVTPRDAMRMPIVAVPTTIGTGSERSANTVVEAHDGRVLVSCPAIKPAIVARDPRGTRGLGAGAVVAGTFEALCRTLAPYVGSAADRAEADELALAVATRLVRLGERVVDDPATVEDDTLRLELSRLSGLSHTSSMHRGRSPFAYKAWFVSHELSWLSGASKSQALAVTLPAVWAAVAQGDSQWGDTARADSAGAVLGRATTDARRRAHLSLALLARDWGVVPTFRQPVAPGELAQRVHARWAVGLPHMSTVSAASLARVSERILTPESHT